MYNATNPKAMGYNKSMTYRFDGYNYLVRLNKGELLVESLTKLAKEKQLGGAWVSGLGGALWAELGFYDLPNQQYHFQKVEKLLEITALQGNLSLKEGKPVFHIHGTFSDSNLHAIGGHVKELCVAGTCEIYLHTIFGEPLTRTPNDEVGLPLLDV